MHQDDFVVLAPDGEIDDRQRAALSRTADRCLTSGRTRVLLLDLSAVDYFDEEAVAWLLGMWRDVTRRGASLVVAGAAPAVARKFARLGLQTLFGVYRDLSSARDALAIRAAESTP